MAVTETETDR